MPNYDFKCNLCSAVVEIQDPTPPACEVCSTTMSRIWTAPGIKFNGSGFYSTGG